MSSLNISSPTRTGRRIPDEDLRDACEAFCNAECMELYKAAPQKFAFLFLRDDNEVATRIVNKWLEDEENVHQAYKSVDLELLHKPSEALEDYQVVRIPETPRAVSFRKGLTRIAQPMVFIPLQDWNCDNGSPWQDTKIEAGEEIVIVGNKSIEFPTSGNCVMLVIRLRN